jgi:hypothetical protein
METNSMNWSGGVWHICHSTLRGITFLWGRARGPHQEAGVEAAWPATIRLRSNARRRVASPADVLHSPGTYGSHFGEWDTLVAWGLYSKPEGGGWQVRRTSIRPPTPIIFRWVISYICIRCVPPLWESVAGIRHGGARIKGDGM